MWCEILPMSVVMCVIKLDICRDYVHPKTHVLIVMRWVIYALIVRKKQDTNIHKLDLTDVEMEILVVDLVQVIVKAKIPIQKAIVQDIVDITILPIISTTEGIIIDPEIPIKAHDQKHRIMVVIQSMKHETPRGAPEVVIVQADTAIANDIIKVMEVIQVITSDKGDEEKR